MTVFDMTAVSTRNFWNKFCALMQKFNCNHVLNLVPLFKYSTATQTLTTKRNAGFAVPFFRRDQITNKFSSRFYLQYYQYTSSSLFLFKMTNYNNKNS